MKSLKSIGGAAAALVMLALSPGTSRAVSTETWRVTGKDGFLTADLESLAISSEGVVILAPAFQAVEGVEAAYVWSLLAGKDGVLRAGTGSNGVIYEVRGGKARELHDSVALSVESIAVGSDGTVYAGTAPDATILAIAKDGKVRTFADLPDKHVWGLAIDGSGRLIAATGDNAHVYRFDASGNPKAVYDGNVTHFTSLALSGNTILVGSEEEGLLYAVEPDGKVRVVMDAKEDEVKSLVVAADGTIYAGVNPAAPPEPAPAAAAATRAEPRPVVYRIRPNGIVEPIWTSPDPTLQSLALTGDGTLLASTGGPEAGGVFSIDPESQHWALLGRPGPPQILSLALSGNDIFVGTGSPGRLFRGTRQGSPTGVLLSTVYDAKQVADWGVLRWDRVEDDGNGTITFRTRTGNSATPDATWSDWSRPVSMAEGSSIESPPGRFIQWEATFHRGSSASPALREVTVAFLEKNLAPVVRSLEVTTSGAQLARGGDSGGPQPVVQNLPGNVRAEFSLNSAFSRTAASDEDAAWVRRYRTLRWEASDPNDDPLRYRVEYRGRGETAWRLVQEDLKDPVYVWDTSQVPDGTYKLRVVATDAPQNAPNEARTADAESDFTVIDNTAPVIAPLTAAMDGGKLKVSARISDVVGPLKRAEVSVDGGDWVIVQPVDRIFDQKVEEISVSLDVKGEGEHLVVVRGIDQTGNIGLGRVATR
jgi:hypothetical protein